VARKLAQEGPEFDTAHHVPHTSPLMDKHEHRALTLGAARALGRLFLINLVLIS
jgi:hypothetical protein